MTDPPCDKERKNFYYRKILIKSRRRLGNESLIKKPSKNKAAPFYFVIGRNGCSTSNLQMRLEKLINLLGHRRWRDDAVTFVRDDFQMGFHPGFL